MTEQPIDWLKTLKKKANKRPDVIVVHSVEGGGKTSFAAQFSGATFIMSESETGLLTLMNRGLVPACNYFPEFETWRDLQDATDQMLASKDRPRTLVIDTIGGIESILHAHVCTQSYRGDMTKQGFQNFREGYTTSVPVYRQWLGKLDAIRNAGTTIVMLAHTNVVNFKNPEGADYHRYVAEVDSSTWAATKKFADMIVFLNFHTEVVDVVGSSSKRGKGTGGRKRVYHFERTAAFDAKHRHGIVDRMLGTGDAAGDYAAFVELVKAGRADNAKPAKPGANPESEDQSSSGGE